MLKIKKVRILKEYEKLLREKDIEGMVQFLEKRDRSNSNSNLEPSKGVSKILSFVQHYAAGNKGIDNDFQRSELGRMGVIQIIIDMLQDQTFLFQACVILDNLANNDTNQEIIRNEGGIPALVSLLMSDSSKNKNTIAKAASALMNLAYDEMNQEVIGRAGAIPLLVRLLENGSEEANESAAGALWMIAICAGNRKIIVDEGAIPLLILLLREGTDEGKENAAGCLCNIADGDDEYFKWAIMRGRSPC